VKAGDAQAAHVGLDRGIHKYEVDTSIIFIDASCIAGMHRGDSLAFSAASTVVAPLDAVPFHPVSAAARVKNTGQASGKRVYARRRRRTDNAEKRMAAAPSRETDRGIRRDN